MCLLVVANDPLPDWLHSVEEHTADDLVVAVLLFLAPNKPYILSQELPQRLCYMGICFICIPHELHIELRGLEKATHFLLTCGRPFVFELLYFCWIWLQSFLPKHIAKS